MPMDKTTGLCPNDLSKSTPIDLDHMSHAEMTEDEQIDAAARRILDRYRHAFEVLAL